MNQHPTSTRRRWKLVSKGAVIRLALLLTALIAAGAYSMWMPGQNHQGPLPPLTVEQVTLARELEEHVQALATEIGERNTQTPGSLDAAVAYLTRQFERAGLTVSKHPYQADGQTCYNLAAQIDGTSRPERIVLVGAHYDSVFGSPGANDNASGVAAVLALARRFAGRPGPRTLRFLAFVNEEPPHFQTASMGSLVYAQACRQEGQQITAMMAFDGLGCYQDQPGSQQYPWPFGLAYPTTGDFIGFVGNLSSAGLVRNCVGSFRRHARFPSQGGALPALIPGIAWSDHWSFCKQGYPVLMVTDSLPFRYRYYHSPGDTADRLDYPRMARVVDGLRQVIEDLRADD